MIASVSAIAVGMPIARHPYRDHSPQKKADIVQHLEHVREALPTSMDPPCEEFVRNLKSLILDVMNSFAAWLPRETDPQLKAHVERYRVEARPALHEVRLIGRLLHFGVDMPIWWDACSRAHELIRQIERNMIWLNNDLLIMRTDGFWTDGVSAPIQY
ncbi:MAG: hypothetical protein ABIQ87_09015 [Rubrivivax sp.]